MKYSSRSFLSALSGGLALVSILALLSACSDDTSVQGPEMSASHDGGAAMDGGLGDGAAQDVWGGSQDAESQNDVGHALPDAGATDGGGDNDIGPTYLDIAGGDGGSTLPGELIALTLTPPSVELPIGAVVSFELIGTFAKGESAPLNAEAKWQSDAPDVVSISQEGVATALSAGQAKIEASIAGLVAQAKVIVTPQKITKLTVTPSTAAVSLGASVAFSAVAMMQDGSLSNVSDVVQWKVNNIAVATIDGAGVATGVGAGETTIVAEMAGHVASAELKVTAAQLTGLVLSPVAPVLTIGASVAFAAEASYDDGKVFEVTGAAKWSSSAPTKVAVDNKGVASALAAGTGIVQAVYGGLSASQVVTVQPAKLLGLKIKPGTATLSAGGQQAFSAWGNYDDGSEAELTAASLWSLSSSGVAVVSNAPGSKGMVTALSAGSVEVKASFGGHEAVAKLTVTAALLKSIAITPAALKVPVGIKSKLSAKGTYSDGKVLDITKEVVWKSGDPKIVTVSNAAGQTGILQGISQGKTVVSAALGQISGQTPVTVTAAALVKLTIAPANTSLPLGTDQPFKALAGYSDGSEVDVTASAMWSSSAPKIGSVSNAKGSKGLLSGIAPGKLTLKATFVGLSASAQVVVTAPVLVGLTVGPQNLKRKAGQKVQYYAMATYSNGLAQNVTTKASWSSSSSSVASVQKTGAFTGIVTAYKQGKATITAKFGGKSASATLTVTDPELISIQVTPAAWSSPVGTLMQFQAVAIFSDDSSQNITWKAEWSSSDSKIASVGNKGGGGMGGPPNKGRTMGYQPGTVIIKATFQNVSGQASLTIKPAEPSGLSVFPGSYTISVGEFRKFNASLLFSDGTSSSATWKATWISSNPKVAEALNGMNQKGIVQALSAGTCTITAAADGFKATATVEVTKATPKSLQITPAVWTVAKGVPAKFSVVAVFSDNTTQNVGWQATFTSSNPKVAAVMNGGGMAGWVQTLEPGKTTIKASWKGLSVTAALTVKSATVSTIQVTPTNPTLAPGSWAKMTAVAVFTDDTTQQITGLASWKSSNAKVATVSNLQTPPGKGLVQTLVAGETTISASWAGKTGATNLKVQSAALVELQVTPFAPVLPLGYVASFRATGIFSDYTVQDLTSLSSWTSSVPKVASVTTTPPYPGYVTPISAGTTEIRAVFQGKKGVSKLKVTAAKLKSIAITPATATLSPSKEQAFKAVGTFDDSTQLEITPWVLWKSSAPAVISVSNAWGSKGVGKALSAGAAKVTAIRDGVSGEAKVVVK